MKPIYPEDVFAGPLSTELRLLRVRQAHDDFEEGNRLLAQASADLTGTKSENARRALAVSRFMEHTYLTTLHVKQWQILKALLLESRKPSGRDTVDLFRLVADIASTSSAGDLNRAMQALAEREIENARAALACYEADTSIGFEASMEYRFSPVHVAWKIDIARESARRAAAFAKG